MNTDHADLLVCKDLFRIMPIDCAVFLSYVLQVSTTEKSEDGWNRCPVMDVEANTGIGRGSQVRIMNELKFMGLLKWKRIGIPASRHIRIDSAKLKGLLRKSAG